MFTPAIWRPSSGERTAGCDSYSFCLLLFFSQTLATAEGCAVADFAVAGLGNVI